MSMEEMKTACERVSRLAAKSGIDVGTVGTSKVQMHADICQSLNALYERKNADYGDSFAKSFEEYGLAAPCIRLEDKLNRLKSLRKRPAQVKDESIEDTLLDLANYAIMTLVEMRMKAISAEPEKNTGGLNHVDP